jgi:ankyrin repeat protein
MYHTHEAFERHDKVYALLGMSTDDAIEAKIVPDYGVEWGKLFQKVVRFVLPGDVALETWADRDMVLVKGKCRVFGRVSQVEMDRAWYRQKVYIAYKAYSIEHEAGSNRSSNSFKATRPTKDWDTCWVLPASVKLIQEGDIVCVLQGQQNPTIMRLRKDHFISVAITVTPIVEVERHSGCVEWQDMLHLKAPPFRDIVLLWSWSTSQDTLPTQGENENKVSVKTLDKDSDSSNIASANDLDLAIIAWNVVEVLMDAMEYEEAEKMIPKPMETFQIILDKDDPRMLEARETFGLCEKGMGKLEDATETLKQVVELRERTQGADHPDTLSSISNLASVYRLYSDDTLRRSTRYPLHLEATAARGEAEKLEMKVHLLDRRENRAEVTHGEAVRIMTWFDEEIINILLSKWSKGVPITQQVIEAAVINKKVGNELLGCLLERRCSNFQITVSLVVNTARSDRAQAIKLLFSIRGISIPGISDVLIIVASHFENDVMEVLLNHRQVEFEITDELVEAAARNRKGEKMFEFLLDREGTGIKITEAVLKAAAKLPNGVMKLLLDRRGDEIEITEAVLVAAAKVNNEDVIQLLLNRRGNEIKTTEALIEAAVRYSAGDVLNLLLIRRGEHIRITQKIVKAAAEQGGTNVMELLLDRKGDEFEVTGEIAEAAARNPRNPRTFKLLLERRGADLSITKGAIKRVAEIGDSSTMKLLLDQAGDNLQIPGDIAESASRNLESGVMELLLDREGADIQITEEALIEAARRSNGVLELLLGRRGIEIEVTEAIVRAAASSEYNMDLLLTRKGRDVQITDAVLREAAKKFKVIKLLFGRRGDEIRITEEVLIEALSGRYGEKTLNLFFCERDAEIQITDRVVEYAALRSRSKEVMQLLLDRRGDQIRITEDLIVAAAASGSKDTVELLLDRGGAEIRITEEILISAAAASRSKDTVELLLDRGGADIRITAEILISAAAAAASGSKDTVELLLDRGGAEIRITAEILISAASSYSKEVMELLLNRRWHEIQITKEVMLSAAENKYNSYGMISVLLERCSGQFDLASMIEDGEILEVVVGHGQKQVLELLMRSCKIENGSFWMKAAEFYKAAYYGPLEVIVKLLEEGFPADYRTRFGRTPLMNAASGGNLRVVGALLEAKELNVNLQDVDGWTALHFAVERERFETIQSLLSYGAEPHCLNTEGWTPLQRAKRSGNRAILSLFER